jgi:hypothetical protein
MGYCWNPTRDLIFSAPKSLIESEDTSAQMPLFAAAAQAEAAELETAPELRGIVDETLLALPPASERPSNKPPCFSASLKIRKA